MTALTAVIRLPAIRADLNPQSIYRIEVGARRTRDSTLRRLAVALSDQPEELCRELVALAGPSLAPESPYAERIGRRRARRRRRKEVLMLRELHESERQRVEAEWAERSARRTEFRAWMRTIDSAFRILQSEGDGPAIRKRATRRSSY